MVILLLCILGKCFLYVKKRKKTSKKNIISALIRLLRISMIHSNICSKELFRICWNLILISILDMNLANS